MQEQRSIGRLGFGCIKFFRVCFSVVFEELKILYGQITNSFVSPKADANALCSEIELSLLLFFIILSFSK